MNRNIILNFLLSKAENENMPDDIILAIEHAKNDMEIASSIFNIASDEKLIEMAIYAEEYAKKKYEYLLALAKNEENQKKVD